LVRKFLAQGIGLGLNYFPSKAGFLDWLASFLKKKGSKTEPKVGFLILEKLNNRVTVWGEPREVPWIPPVGIRFSLVGFRPILTFGAKFGRDWPPLGGIILIL